VPSTTCSSLLHILSQVGIGSVQLVRIILFLRRSSFTPVLPHGQLVSLDGKRGQGGQSAE